MKGRIVVCKAYNQPFEIEEYDVPDPEPGGGGAAHDPSRRVRVGPACLER